MYRILVNAKLSRDLYEEGYFSGCYRCDSSEGKITFISYSNGNDINKNNIKTFKTMSQARAKLKFLEEKIKLNGYMWDWELKIVETGGEYDE